MGKYEEALERAREIYNAPVATIVTRTFLEQIFPELKESEDERIRKAIGVAICGTKATSILEANGSTLPEALDYLEKQKEQKPALYWHKIKAYDYLPCRAYLWKLAYEEENNFMGRCHVDGYLVPNEPVGVGCDTWYLPVEDIKNLPKEEELDTVSPMKTVEQKPAARENDFVSKPKNSVEILKHYLTWATTEEDNCPYSWKELADAIRDGIKALEEQKPYEPKNWPIDKDNLTQKQKPAE